MISHTALLRSLYHFRTLVLILYYLLVSTLVWVALGRGGDLRVIDGKESRRTLSRRRGKWPCPDNRRLLRHLRLLRHCPLPLPGFGALLLVLVTFRAYCDYGHGGRWRAGKWAMFPVGVTFFTASDCSKTIRRPRLCVGVKRRTCPNLKTFEQLVQNAFKIITNLSFCAPLAEQ